MSVKHSLGEEFLTSHPWTVTLILPSDIELLPDLVLESCLYRKGVDAVYLKFGSDRVCIYNMG